MRNSAETDWSHWQQQIRGYFESHGFLPTPTLEGLEVPIDILTDCWMAADTNPKELPALCRTQDAVGSPIERAAVVLFLWYLTGDEPYLRLPETEERERREAMASLFEEAVVVLPVDEIDDPRRIRWELLFAASANQWMRVDELVRQWIHVEPAAERNALAALARINFLSVSSFREDYRVPDYWGSYEGAKYSAAGGLLASIQALQLDNRSPLSAAEWTLPSSLSTDEFRRVLDAENAISRLLDAASSDPMLDAIKAWCIAVIAVRQKNTRRTRDAADRYAQIARGENLLKQLPEAAERIRRLPAWSAAMLYRMSGALDEARTMAEFWTEVDCEAPEAWKFRAELERQLGIEAYPDSYEHYVRLSPDTDTSWEHSELLRLLLESSDRRAADRALRELSLTHPDRSVIEEVLNWDWPSYRALADETRRRWWEGLLFVCDPRVREVFGCTPWRYAAGCFGEAVALELRARIFDPLAGRPDFSRNDLPDRERRVANAIAGSRATLGMMVEALELTQSQASLLGQLIDRFLLRVHRPVRFHLKAKPAIARLRAATEARNDAVHADIEPEAAKQVYVDAKTFLDVLVKADPRITQVV